MVAAPRLLVVVAPNGLGHFRRAVAIVSALAAEHRPAPSITVVAADWQRRRMRGWAPLDRLVAGSTRWVDGVTEPGVTWSTDPARYADGRLRAWERRLAAEPAVAAADLVVSDNLVGTLAARPDAVLLGSFLWSDVLGAAYPDDPQVADLVRHDRALLAELRPPMVCVADMAMPGVLARTAAVPVGWMCDDPEPPDPDSDPDPGRDPASGGDAIAVLGGRTGAADDLLVSAARELVVRGRRVLVDAAVAGQVPGAGTFAYDRPSWAATGAVLCRPGMGTLTECVGRRIPVFALAEAGNIELTHNAAALAAAGLGVDLGVGTRGADVADSLVQTLADQGGSIRRRMRELNTHGVAQAASYLAGRLDLEPTVPDRP